jgi:myo-inositol catabolism protein IolC
VNNRGLYLLAVDHRRSYERLLGLDPPIAADDVARLTAAKGLVAEALGDVAAARRDLAGDGDLGILIDDVYGAAAIATARAAGVAVALAFEQSGRRVLEFEHADWRERLATDPPDYVKVLVRHRTDGDAADIAIQLDRLRAVSDACAASTAGFMLELLTPYTDAELAGAPAEQLERTLRPRLVVEAIAQIEDAGVRADVWKVEGVADPGGCSAIAAAAGRCGGRVVVLGAGAPVDVVTRWLESGAAAGYAGFAVGRSIWSDAVIAHGRGELDDAAARARIAARYEHFIDTFRAAL